jgi:hypothetical protein
MNKRIFISILIFTALSFGSNCRSKTVVKKLVNQNASISNKSETKKIDGVMYHLPKTIVQITVPVNKVTKTPGDFAEFAPCFFSASERDGMVDKQSQKFSINPPNFSSRGVPDTSETYVIKTKGKYFESKSLFVEYAPGGYILQKGEAESKNETLEFTVKAIATAAGIASKASVFAIGASDEQKKIQLEALSEEYNCYQKLNAAGIDVSAPKTEVDNDMKRIFGTVAALTDTEKLQRLQTPNEFRNNYQTAKKLFEELRALISTRDAILANGGNNIPPETYKQMLEKNAEAIAAHRAAFLGLTSKEVWAATLEFEPKKGAAENYSSLLFSYSKTKGVCNNGQLKEKNIPINGAFKFTDPNEEVCDDTTEDKVQALWLKVVKSDDQAYLDSVEAANENAAQDDKSRGWFYRVPANSVVTLQTQEFACQQKPGAGAKKSCLINSLAINGTITANYEGIAAPVTGIAINSNQIARNETPVAQLGVVASVPASTAGRSSVTAIMLDPTTGAMKNYKSSSLPLVDKAILDDAQKAANSTIDALDPLNRKKRELEELKTQNDINTEKKKLSNTNTGNSETGNDQ